MEQGQLGPVEFLVIAFDGPKFKGEIAYAMRKAVDAKIIRIIDILFIRREADGKVSFYELTDLDTDTQSLFDPIVDNVSGMFTSADIEAVSETLPLDSAAGMMLFEHLWAVDIRDAIKNSGGRLVRGGLIRPEEIEAKRAWLLSNPD